MSALLPMVIVRRFYRKGSYRMGSKITVEGKKWGKDVRTGRKRPAGDNILSPRTPIGQVDCAEARGIASSHALTPYDQERWRSVSSHARPHLTLTSC